MSTHERPRLTRRDAEHLLDDPASSSSALGHVLAAASASQAHDGEVTSGNTPTGPSMVDPARENAAVAAFVAARLSPSATHLGSDSMSLNGRKAARRAVIATAALVSVTTGGFALAATGHLPTLPEQASDRATDAVAQRGPSSTATTTATTESTTETTTEATTDAADSTTAPTEGTGSESTSPTPTPNLEGLCKAFQASDKSGHGKALDSAAFTALATAAGGKENIATYCVSLIGEPKPKPTQAATGKPTAKPTQAATGKPTAKPTQAATGKPTAKPTQAATGKPTDKPSRSGKGKPEGVGKR